MSSEERQACFQQLYDDTLELIKESIEGSQWSGALALTAASVFAARRFHRSAAWSALMLGLRSRCFRRAPTRSVRADVVDEIREKLRLREMDGFLVVAGDRGVGKTTAIDTATEK